MSKMGGIQSNRRRSGTNGSCRVSKWKDTSTIDSNNIIHQSRRRNCESNGNKSSRRRININWNSDDNGSKKPSQRRANITGKNNNKGSNGISILGKRKNPSMTLIDACEEQNSSFDLNINIDSNNKHDKSCPSEPKELSTSKISDKNDIINNELSGPSMMNIDKPSEQRSNIDSKMNMDSNNNKNNNNDKSCSCEQKELSTSKISDNSDIINGDISEPSMMNTNKPSEQHSNIDSKMNMDSNNKKKNNNDKSCLSEQKELSISKISDNSDIINGDISEPSMVGTDKPSEQHSNIDSRMNIDSNNNNIHDNGCLSEQKELSTSKISDNSHINNDDISQPSTSKNDTYIDKLDNIDPKMNIDSNNNNIHDNGCLGEQKELSTSKISDNRDSSNDDISQPSTSKNDTYIDKLDNIDPKMNTISNKDSKHEISCSIEQKELSSSKKIDNNDSSDSGILYKQEEPMKSDDTSTQQHSSSDTNESSICNNKQDKSCPSERKELSISKKIYSRDSGDAGILYKRENVHMKNIDRVSQQIKIFKPRFSRPKTIQEEGYFVIESRSTKFQKSRFQDKRNPGKQAQVTDIPRYHQLFQHSSINTDKIRISDKKQDSSCVRERKNAPISSISDNNNDIGTLDQGKELPPIMNIEASSQRESVNSNTNNKDDSHILSDRMGLSMIDLDSAKGIVQHACAAALLGSHCTNHYDIRPPNTENGDDIRRQNEFEEFVTSTISRAISSIVAAKVNTKIHPSTEPPQNTTPRPTKKRRYSSPLHQPQHLRGSKVEGLEHAETLHTMCSLFPLEMELTEDEEKKCLASEPETMEFGNRDYAPVSESEVESNHSNSSSDHDSLLPPVGTGCAPTIPREDLTPENNNSTIITCETTLATIMPELPSAPQLSPQRLRSSTRASTTRVFIRPTPVNAVTDTDTDATVMSQTDLQPKPSSVSNEMSSPSSAGDDVDDDYGFPFIGVAGDEGSGIISSQLGMDQYDDDNCIIRFSKVGSGIQQEVPPFHIDIGPR